MNEKINKIAQITLLFQSYNRRKYSDAQMSAIFLNLSIF